MVDKSKTEAEQREQEYRKRALRSNDVKKHRNDAIELLEEVILSLGAQHSGRYIQNFPIRLNVWRAFIGDADDFRDLILTPNYLVPIADVVDQIRGSLEAENTYSPQDHRLITLSNSIHLRITLEDLLCKLLPLTYWWRNVGKGILDKIQAILDTSDVQSLLSSKSNKNTQNTENKKNLITLSQSLLTEEYIAVMRPVIAWSIIQTADTQYQAVLDKLSPLKAGKTARGVAVAYETAELERYRLIERYCGILLDLSEETTGGGKPEGFQDRINDNDVDLTEAVAFLADVLKSLQKFTEVLAAQKGGNEQNESGAPIWSMDVNRLGDWSIATSRKTIKADAAEQVFGGATGSISWAVIDSGIDARHPAFFKKPFDKRDSDAPEGVKALKDIDEQARLNQSRVKATYDFYRLMHLFRGDYQDLLLPETLKDLRKNLSENTEVFAKVRALVEHDNEVEDTAIFLQIFLMNTPRRSRTPSSKNLIEALSNDSNFIDEAMEYATSIKRILKTGQPIDWHLMEPLLKVPHEKGHYDPPKNPHGTHVAGILGGNLKKGVLITKAQEEGPYTDHSGVCPKIGLYDLRVSNDAGQSEEFLVLAAMQFISYLNRNRNLPKVHGANVSLSLKHAVKDYACGQTPICVESNRLVGEGVVVVAAAGNLGFKRLRSETGLIQAYNAVSVTDPGNAADVITVGSTFRDKPHIYGVSYFSSRGPTGDGRQKPDIVAPGEKIFSAMPDDDFGPMDGTSMATPHVSGAAALLMARHKELIGHPQKIKSILCETATDIGRVKEFQGAGLVDIFRALQSV